MATAPPPKPIFTKRWGSLKNWGADEDRIERPPFADLGRRVHAGCDPCPDFCLTGGRRVRHSQHVFNAALRRQGGFPAAAAIGIQRAALGTISIRSSGRSRAYRAGAGFSFSRANTRRKKCAANLSGPRRKGAGHGTE